MSLKFWRPWIDPHRCGEGSQPERYVLRSGCEARFLGIAAADQLIEAVDDPERAWAFHTHERAVATARTVASVFGQPVDVVKLQ